MAGIFGPQSKSTVDYVQSMCDTLDIPHITARWDPEPKRGNVVNLYPHADTLSTVLHTFDYGDSHDEYPLTTRGLTGAPRQNDDPKLPREAKVRVQRNPSPIHVGDR